MTGRGRCNSKKSEGKGSASHSSSALWFIPLLILACFCQNELLESQA